VTPRELIQYRWLPEIWSRRLKRAGQVGFVFFLVKGLVWLVVSGCLAYYATGQ
jgi:hypothetical protein